MQWGGALLTPMPNGVEAKCLYDVKNCIQIVGGQVKIQDGDAQAALRSTSSQLGTRRFLGKALQRGLEATLHWALQGLQS